MGGEGEKGMEKRPIASIEEHFSKMEDPRVERNKLHKLLDIIMITICGVICGADNWVDIAMFGKKKEKWLRQFLEMSNGVPSQDTFGRYLGYCGRRDFRNVFTSG
jgi:hypothetical protein